MGERSGRGPLQGNWRFQIGDWRFEGEVGTRPLAGQLVISDWGLAIWGRGRDEAPCRAIGDFRLGIGDLGEKSGGGPLQGNWRFQIGDWRSGGEVGTRVSARLGVEPAWPERPETVRRDASRLLFTPLVLPGAILAGECPAVKADPVASGVLRPIQRSVCRREQGVEGVVLLHDSHADADGD